MYVCMHVCMYVCMYRNGKIPEGQVYVPRLEPTAPTRLANRNPAHYPSRHCTILVHLPFREFHLYLY